MTTASAPSAATVQITPGEGIYELAGDRPAWIWAHTCPDPKCDCRAALILATTEGREVLLERGATVHEAWRSGVEYAQVAWRLHDLDHFFIDIDTTDAYWTNGERRIDVSDHPRIGKILASMDGELLDGIGRLWYRGKGWPDPEQQILAAQEIVLRGWQPGDLVAWDELCTGLRQDIYVLGRHHYEAAEMYCPVAGCDCGEVVIHFEARFPRGAPDPGRIVVHASGEARLESRKRGRDCLEHLWTAFCRRHPRYPARFARRDATVKSLGERFTTPAPPRSAIGAKVGRNDSCPCGSGRKYKKCCGIS